MAEGPSPSHPPSEPRPGPERRGLRDFGIGYDRPARLQSIAALVLMFALVAIPLYFWRRPRVEGQVVAPDAEAPLVSAPLAPAEAGAAPDVDGGGAVALGEPKVTECHNPGPKHTPVEQCDRLGDFEKLFTKAIQDAASCAVGAGSSGTLPFVADVSFMRKRTPIQLTVAKDGRTLKSPKVGAACLTAVKKSLAGATLDGIKHEHTRYKIEILASYAGSK